MNYTMNRHFEYISRDSRSIRRNFFIEQRAGSPRSYFRLTRHKFQFMSAWNQAALKRPA